MTWPAGRGRTAALRTARPTPGRIGGGPAVAEAEEPTAGGEGSRHGRAYRLELLCEVMQRARAQAAALDGLGLHGTRQVSQ